MTKTRAGFNAEFERITRIRMQPRSDTFARCTGRHDPVHHTTMGLSDPALQIGLGCPICYPPDGRYRGKS